MCYLVPMCMTTNDNGLSPARNKPRNGFADNRLSKNCSTKDITYCAIRTKPHFLQFELYTVQHTVKLQPISTFLMHK